MLHEKPPFFVVMGICILFFYGCSTLGTADSKINQKRYSEAIPLYEEYLAKNPNQDNEAYCLIKKWYELTVKISTIKDIYRG